MGRVIFPSDSSITSENHWEVERIKGGHFSACRKILISLVYGAYNYDMTWSFIKPLYRRGGILTYFIYNAKAKIAFKSFEYANQSTFVYRLSFLALKGYQQVIFQMLSKSIEDDEIELELSYVFAHLCKHYAEKIHQTPIRNVLRRIYYCWHFPYLKIVVRALWKNSIHVIF